LVKNSQAANGVKTGQWNTMSSHRALTVKTKNEAQFTLGKFLLIVLDQQTLLRNFANLQLTAQFRGK